MEMSTQIANRIVSEVNRIIPQKINLMDSKGIIIASSDPARVGGFHEGAWKIITEGLAEVRVREDGEFLGARRGLNYPIMMEDSLVGVLGVTGEYEQIVDSAKIIRQMMVLLLSEAENAEQRLMGENVRNRYLDEWLNGERKNINTLFVERGLMLNINPELPRRVMACEVYADRTPDQSYELLRQIEAAEQVVKRELRAWDGNNLFLKAASTLICLVTLQKDEELERLAAALQKRVEGEASGLHLAVGIDDRLSPYTQMHTNCIKARRALAACRRTRKWSVRKYADLNMEVFADRLDTMTKQEYIHKILSGFSGEEIARTLALLEVFYDNDGSVTQTAEQLFLHKNTVQYRLRRIAERTGYDPRSIRHSSLFYNAIYFYREIRDEMPD